MTTTMNIQEIKTETLLTRIYPDREMLGEEAARLAAVKVNKLLNQKEEINILFAAAPLKTSSLLLYKTKTFPGSASMHCTWTNISD